MSAPENLASENSVGLSNGSGAAAILAAGIGSFAVAFLAIAADKSAFVKNLFVFYKPTGALSGVTTVAVLLWLAAWAILDGAKGRFLCGASTSLRLRCSASACC